MWFGGGGGVYGCPTSRSRKFKDPGRGFFPLVHCLRAVWRGYDDMAAAPLSGHPWVCGIDVGGGTLSGPRAAGGEWRVGERVFGIPEWSAGLSGLGPAGTAAVGTAGNYLFGG